MSMKYRRKFKVQILLQVFHGERSPDGKKTEAWNSLWLKNGISCNLQILWQYCSQGVLMVSPWNWDQGYRSSFHSVDFPSLALIQTHTRK